MKPGITDILSIEPHPTGDRWDVCVWMMNGTKLIIGENLEMTKAETMHDNLYIFLRHIMETVETDTTGDCMAQVREIMDRFEPSVKFRRSATARRKENQ